MTDWTAEQLTALAERVAAGPHVVRLSSGPSGTIAAHLPGRRVAGIRLREDRLEVHVVMAWTSTVDQVERAVEAAVSATLEPAPVVDVVVDDIDDPETSGDDAELTDEGGPELQELPSGELPDGSSDSEGPTGQLTGRSGSPSNR